MSNSFLQTTIPQGGTQDICVTQNGTSGNGLAFSGSLGGNFINNGYMRSLSFTSANDLSSVFFTVTGVQNGVPLTETVVGPNQTTVYSINYYDYITSIVPSGGALGISVGSGPLTRIYFPLSLSLSRYSVPYMTLALINPSQDATTSVHGLVTYPNSLINWDPDNIAGFESGTFSVKAEDNVEKYQLTKENLQLYNALIITVKGFPSGNVYVNAVQP